MGPVANRLGETFVDPDTTPAVITFRRRLPHVYGNGQPLFVTFCLHGNLPEDRKFPDGITSGEAFVAMDRLLADARTGPFHLRRPEIAEMVTEAILWRDARQYELHPYVVLPNHAHLLFTPLVSVSKLMQSLKRFTALTPIGNRLPAGMWPH